MCETEANSHRYHKPGSIEIYSEMLSAASFDWKMVAIVGHRRRAVPEAVPPRRVMPELVYQADCCKSDLHV